ncbi:MAG TPA: hypothetical protein VMF31_06605 [Solirubrobacterales bacterium]|nr:hypothetical protein [Solirubrobacterales bacterium]
MIAVCGIGTMGLSGIASADPPVVRDAFGWDASDENSTDLPGLTWSSSGGGDYEKREGCDVDMFGSCEFFGDPSDPLVRVDASGTYPVGSRAGWTYTVPGGPDTYLKKVSATAINVTGESELTLETGEPRAYLGVWDGSGWSASETSIETEGFGIFDHLGDEDDRQVKFGIEAASAPSFAEDHWAGMAALVAELGDDVPPLQTVDPLDVPSGWVDETPIDIPVAAEDNGLGLLNITAIGSKRVAANPFDWYVATESFDCVGNTDDPCPLEAPSGTEITIEPALMREGHALLSIGVFDAKENLAVNEDYDHNMKIDTKDPVVTLGGSFTTAPGMVLDGPLYALESDAVDGNLTVANSGVVKIEVLVDDVVIDSDTQSCATENCDMGLDTDIDPDNYANGAHVLKVKATDAVGHVKTETVPFEVDR